MSLSLATEIFRGCDYNYKDEIDYDRWEFLGAGVSRYAYLCKVDGMVYKYGNSSCNRTEMEAAAWLRQNKPLPGIFWPTFKVYEFGYLRPSVSETVYLRNEGYLEWNTSEYMWFKHALVCVAVTDLHPGNVWRWRGMMTIVDLGYAIVPE